MHRPGAVVEITQRTFQGRYLLRPSQEANDLIVGCLARARQKNPGVCLHAVSVMSNHLHILASFDTAEVMASFMCHLKTNLSKELGRLHDWPGALWHGRYHSVPVSDEPAAQIARLRYLLSQGVKEGLVMAPEDWPGVHPARPLRTGEAMKGKWIDRTRMYAASLRGKEIREADFTTPQEVQLEPIPALESPEFQGFRSELARLLEEIEEESLDHHRADGTAPAGVREILSMDPHHRPRKPARSPKPLFHAATRRVRDALIEGFREFLVAYRTAAEKLAAGDRSAQFPEGSFPARLPFVSPALAAC
ncbi:MAG: transposase [Acidobacteriota bacterium]